MADASSTRTQSNQRSDSAEPVKNGGESSPPRLADQSSQGKTTIAATVVQKIAGIAAREVSGVTVEVGEKQAATSRSTTSTSPATRPRSRPGNPAWSNPPTTVEFATMSLTAPIPSARCRSERVAEAVAAAVRAHPAVDRLRGRISGEIRRITGYEARSIAVTVTALLR